MSPELPTSLQESIALITSSDSGNSRFGTGFVFRQRQDAAYLLTCAHVVRDVGGDGQVLVDGCPGTVVASGEEKGLDLAVLQVQDEKLNCKPPLSLQSTGEKDLVFVTAGYWRLDQEIRELRRLPGYLGDQVWLQSRFINSRVSAWYLAIEDNYSLEPGYSGSPVVDAATGGVVGIVSHRQGDDTGLAIASHHVNALLDESLKTARVFISYRSQPPDAELAQSFHMALQAAGHQVFMAAESIRLGENWSRRIDQELEQCDYFLLLLSSQSAISEMVTKEVQRAKQLRETRPSRKPGILPIRVNFPLGESLNYDLQNYLDRVQQREWRSPTDTPKILEEVLAILESGQLPDPVEPRTDSTILIDHPDAPPVPVAPPELPGGQVDLASKYYVERHPIEPKCYEAIVNPGVLIRIKAPRQMGKTSLMSRILRHGEQQDYLAVPLSFQLADAAIFSDLDKFLRWFCASVGRRLKLPNRLNDYWDEIFGVKDNCTAYFEEYLLPEISAPVVLGLDEVDMVFEHPNIAADFMGLLRAWHEAAKVNDLWKKLRLVVVHSTEVYIPMNINQSPFNVGLPIELPEFTPQQVLDLAQRHGLNWGEAEVTRLMAMVGGHPYLVRVALYPLARQETTLDELLAIAPTEAGPYGDHLRRHLWNLQQREEMAAATKRVMASSRPTRLEAVQAFQLHSMGIVHLQGNEVVPRCDLYRQYFGDRLKVRG
ncbi:MAG: TIR domain-containing protein [Cyanothece sp. SIO2G6]|nr:TIR domain-containing protein [Cyanothece sp. SIO2G6]